MRPQQSFVCLTYCEEVDMEYNVSLEHCVYISNTFIYSIWSKKMIKDCEPKPSLWTNIHAEFIRYVFNCIVNVVLKPQCSTSAIISRQPNQTKQYKSKAKLNTFTHLHTKWAVDENKRRHRRQCMNVAFGMGKTTEQKIGRQVYDLWHTDKL